MTRFPKGKMTDAEWADAVLSFDPFAGDFGDGEVRLSNKIVVGRKEHTCHICYETIKVGEKQRVMTEKDHDEIVTFRWCRACCDAFAKTLQDDDGKAITARYEIARKKDLASREVKP